MLIRTDRRARDRRGPPRLAETLERKAPRRREDRRDAPRVPRVILVRELGTDADFERSPGDLSLAGVMWRSDRFPPSRKVEIAVRIPGFAQPVVATAEVTRVELLDDELEIRARFEEIDVKAELAIARFIDDRAKLNAALSS